MKSQLPLLPDRELVSEGAKALSRTIGIFFLALRGLIVVVLVAALFGGIFHINADEEGMLFHFGKLVKRDGQEILKSGTWYWAWPHPIDVVKRIPAKRSITLTTGPIFWPKGDVNRLEAAQKAPPPSPNGGNVLRPGEDGYLLTGDANIMHMVWTISYQVTDAKSYYLNFVEDTPAAAGATPRNTPVERRGVEKLIESVLANAVLVEVAAWDVEQVLGLAQQAEILAGKAEGIPAPATDTSQAARESLDRAVRRRVEARLKELDIGIEVQAVSLVGIQPPLAVQESFRAVFAAAADYRTEIARSKSYAQRVEADAEGKAAQVISAARAYQTRTVESVKASASYFSKVLDEYRKNPETMLVSLYSDTVRDILARAETKYIVHSKETGRQEVRLLLGPEPEKAKPVSGAGAPPAEPGK